MKGLIGKKVGMTRVFTPEGQSVGVTVILAGPNVIAQVKTLEKDGYSAVQLGFGAKRHPNLPEAGHALKQAGWFKLSAKADPGAAPPEDAPDFKGARAKGLLSSFKAIRELRVQGPSGLAELKGALLEENPELAGIDLEKDPSALRGKTLGPLLFAPGDRLAVTGVSKGRGTAGVMKRHGFGGGRATHGCLTPRSGGSIGCAADPSRVVPGKKMAGHHGARKTTVKNLRVVDVRPDRGVILVKGAVPGPPGGLLTLRKI